MIHMTQQWRVGDRAPRGRRQLLDWNDLDQIQDRECVCELGPWNRRPGECFRCDGSVRPTVRPTARPATGQLTVS